MSLCKRLADNDPEFDHLILSKECQNVIKVFEALKSNQTIIFLTFQANFFTPVYFASLIELLASKPFTGLVFKKNILTFDQLKSLLLHCTSVVSISLIQCKLNDDHIPLLTAFVSANPNLTELNLQGNYFSSEGLAVLNNLRVLKMNCVIFS